MDVGRNPDAKLTTPMPALAWIILSVHLAIIVFNVAGLVLIPLGERLRWRWVRAFGWRLAHLLILAVVAAQALAGRACFLTDWQADLGGSDRGTPLFAGWIDRVIYLPLPLWVFTLAYVLVWLYVLWLWWRVPPRKPWRARRASRAR